MLSERVPIALIGLLARYFWLTENLLSTRCEEEHAFTCVFSLASYKTSLDKFLGLLFVFLILLDIQPFFTKFCQCLKGIILIALIYSFSRITPWILFDFLDLFLLVSRYATQIYNAPIEISRPRFPRRSVENPNLNLNQQMMRLMRMIETSNERTAKLLDYFMDRDRNRKSRNSSPYAGLYKSKFNYDEDEDDKFFNK